MTREPTSTVSRRRFLGGGAAVVLSTAAGASVLAACSDDTSTVNASDDTSGGDTAGGTTGGGARPRARLPFEGLHQQGITTPAPESAIVVAFDCVASDVEALEKMFATLTAATRDLMAGTPAPDLDPLLPPADNLIVGEEPPADDVTVTVAVGASLFDDRYGLAALKPKQLVPMPQFPNDKPDPARLHGDLAIQICAGTPATCNHVLRQLMRATRDTLVLKWMMPGFNTPNTLGPGRASGRNMLGFKDGTANPDTADDELMNTLVWIREGDDEPAWTVGGTYQAIRLIRNRVEFWDRTPLRTQETIIGRHKSSGAPLGGADEAEIPDFSTDPDGVKFRLDGHIRLANPRTPETEKNRILRRGFNYSAGFDSAGQLDQGLLFVCFQRSLNDGFLAVQNRLNGEALEEYITPFGGGLFFALPGVPTGAGSFGDALFDRAALTR
jgi:deferrochelatase/peroxidase EfeB